jgi:CBS domain containing-hemolysin-like protein
MWLDVGLFLLALGLAGAASAAQSAFAYLNAIRLRRLMQQGASRSQAVFEVVHNPGAVFSGLAVLYLLSVAIAAVVTLDFLLRFVEPDGLKAVAGVSAIIMVLMAQTMGREIATLRPEPVGVTLYGALRAIGLATQPLMRPWRALVSRLLQRLFGSRPEDRLATSEEDLRILVDAVEETEALEEEEREMITSIFELSDRDVREIMVPRVDVIAVEGSRSVAEAVDILISTGHSRVPVFDENLDHIVGLVHLRDLTASIRSGQEDAPVASLVRPVYVVPETKKIDELLRDFQQERVQMVVVADEYGGTAGIVTVEDLLEEIVGEIHDEYDVEEQWVQRISDREAIMDARISIHDANEVLPLELDAADSDTLGGLVYQHLEKVPAVADVVQLDRCTIRVIATKGRRVQRVHIIMTEQA